MSRKDYVAIAEAIRSATMGPAEGPTWEARVAPHMRDQARDQAANGPQMIHSVRLVNALTLYMARDNPRFDVRRFEKACETVDVDAPRYVAWGAALGESK